MEIRTYTSLNWPAVREFIDAHWQAGHPYTHRKLFEWQFRGFGPHARPAGRIMVHEGEIVGFLGATPGEYFADSQILIGAAFDLWVIRPDYRDRALGLLLMRAIEEEFETTCCLGVNLEAVRFYTTRGYGLGERLNRYVAPLDRRKFQSLVAASAGPPARFAPIVTPLPTEPLEPGVFPNLFELQVLYERTVERVFRFGLHRSAAFWKWRYVQSAGFDYLMWGDPLREGAIVGRVERIISPDTPGLDGLPVLRLIELLPPSKKAWEGEACTPFVQLLRNVLTWAARRGCVLADYQNSSGRLAHLLKDVGFRETAAGSACAVARTPDLFQPLQFDASPINFVWRLSRSMVPLPTVDDIYLVKSDNGMDRPNVWPLPETYNSSGILEGANKASSRDNLDARLASSRQHTANDSSVCVK